MDWASLAKQWIAQREVMGLTSSIVTLSNSDTLSHYMSQPMQQVPVAPPPPPPPPQSTDDVTPDDVTPGDLPPAGQGVAPADSDTGPAHGLTSVLLSLSKCFLSYTVQTHPGKSWFFPGFSRPWKNSLVIGC